MSASSPKVNIDTEEHAEGIDHLAWRCGEFLRYPPMEKGTEADAHWKTVSDHLMEQQRARCEAWKDEVQTLLVFSGLFSAVVTGLLVESYKSLSQDPIQVLLTKLVDQGASVPSQVSGTFNPSASSKRVNALWFLSLVLNIATALFGIVALQWLRELLRPSPQNAPVRQLTGLLYMQDQALNRFMVPEIFTALPLLLIISLILFLVGMVDFLWDLNHLITTPVMLAVFFIFSFLLFTTVYPGLQALPCHIPNKRRSATPRAPCPYRSPQSWAFLSLVMSIKFWLRHVLGRLLSYFKIGPSFIQRHFSQAYYKAGWIHHGLLWLRQRDLDVLAFHSDENLRDLSLWYSFPDAENLPLGLYDTVNALLITKTDFSRTRSDKLPEVFQCFHDITSENEFHYSYYIVILYIHDYLLQLKHRPLSPLPSDWPFDFRGEAIECVNFSVDNARLHFLFNSSPTRIPVGTAYHLELCVRLMRWATEHIGTQYTQLGQQEYPYTPGSYIWRTARNQPHVLGQIVPQVRHIFSRFFEIAPDYHPSESEIGKTLLTTSFLKHMLEGSVILLGNPDVDFVDAILVKVIKCLSETSSEGQEYLLVAAAIIAGQMDSELFDPKEQVNLLQALSVYNQRCNQDHVSQLFNSIHNSQTSQEWPQYISHLLSWSKSVDGPEDAEVLKLSCEGKDNGSIEQVVDLTKTEKINAGTSSSNPKPNPVQNAHHSTQGPPSPSITHSITNGSNRHLIEGSSSSPISASLANNKYNRDVFIDIETEIPAQDLEASASAVSQ